MGGSEKSIVGFYGELAVGGGEEMSDLGVVASDITNSPIVRSGSNGMSNRAMDVGKITNLHVHYGEQAHYKAHPSFQADDGVQHARSSIRNGDGSALA